MMGYRTSGAFTTFGHVFLAVDGPGSVFWWSTQPRKYTPLFRGAPYRAVSMWVPNNYRAV